MPIKILGVRDWLDDFVERTGRGRFGRWLALRVPDSQARTERLLERGVGVLVEAGVLWLVFHARG